MIDLEVPVEGVALNTLDAFLSSDESPPDSMMLSDVDGFLTAIAVGPELVMPSEWLPVIWGGRVGMWRGRSRPGMSVAAPFVWRCLSGSTIAPFPHPSHRTGHAAFPASGSRTRPHAFAHGTSCPSRVRRTSPKVS